MDIVEKIFDDCLLQENDGFNNCIKAEGITNLAIFNQDRLQQHKPEIETMLNGLPKDFKIPVEDNHLTKLHYTLEKLLQLGIGIGKVKPPIFLKKKSETLPNEHVYSMASNQ
ncbi:MAG: hypothetical protein PHS06_03430 [Candidatus Shapirobacteria bacterium]|nr:hypothetical protein [Candidatus Shapirobacteria bacterium]